MRQKREVKDDEGWTGARVSYKPHPSAEPETGTVLRMGSGKLPCVFVHFGNDQTAKLCYTKDLERLK